MHRVALCDGGSGAQLQSNSVMGVVVLSCDGGSGDGGSGVMGVVM